MAHNPKNPTNQHLKYDKAKLIANYKFVKIDMIRKPNLISNSNTLKELRSEILKMHETAKDVQQLEAEFVAKHNMIIGDTTYDKLVSTAGQTLNSIVDLSDDLGHKTYDQLVAITEEYKRKVPPFSTKAKPTNATEGQIALWNNNIDLYYGRFKKLQTLYNALDMQDPQFAYKFYMLDFKIKDAKKQFHTVFNEQFKLEFASFLSNLVTPGIYEDAYKDLQDLVLTLSDLVSQLSQLLYKNKTRELVDQYRDAFHYRYAVDEDDKLVILGDDQDNWGCDLN